MAYQSLKQVFSAYNLISRCFHESTENAQWFQDFYLTYYSILTPDIHVVTEIIKQKNLFFAKKDSLLFDIVEMGRKINTTLKLVRHNFNFYVFGSDINDFIEQMKKFITIDPFVVDARTDEFNQQYMSTLILFNRYIKPVVGNWYEKQAKLFGSAQKQVKLSEPPQIEVKKSEILDGEIIEFDEFSEKNDNPFTFFDLLIGYFDLDPEVLNEVKDFIEENNVIFQSDTDESDDKHFQLFLNDQQSIVLKIQSLKDRFIKYSRRFFERHPNKKTSKLNSLLVLSERAGIRTPDNLIKSQVLYHLS